MTETSSRLLELLSLLQARREWSGTELAERLGELSLRGAVVYWMRVYARIRLLLNRVNLSRK